MARVLSFSKVDAYFQELADKHIDIKDYCSTSRNWLIKWQLSQVFNPILVFSTILVSYPVMSTFNRTSLFLFYFPKYLLMISQHKEPQLIPLKRLV
jgi:hypothetical protein